MPVISPQQFIQLADRLAATYGLLIWAEKKYMAPVEPAIYQEGQVYPARLLVDLTGTGTQILLTAKNTGTSGNSIFFSTVLPGAPDSPLASNCVGTNLVLSLKTDASNKSNTTVEEAIAFLQSTPDFTDHVNIIYPVSGVGGYVQPWPMLPLSGGIGQGTGQLPLFTVMATNAGVAGNYLTLTINYPAAANQQFDVCWDRRNLVIDLPTNGASAVTMTLGEFQVALAEVTDEFVVVTDSPDEVVPEVAQINFSGGGTGSFAQVVLTPAPGSPTVDPAVVTGLMTPAQLLDENFTAVTLSKGLGYLEAFQGALAQHFVLTGYSGGMAGFMLDNDIRVHKNFSTLTSQRINSTEASANVFRPDQVILGTVKMTFGVPPSPPSSPPPPPPPSLFLAFTPGTPLGTGEGNQSETNYAKQALVAVLVNGPLAKDWEFTLDLMDDVGTSVISDPIEFKLNDQIGTTLPITAGLITKFYKVNGAVGVTPGTLDDQVFITQVVERQITL